MKHKPPFPESKIQFSELKAIREISEGYTHLGEDYILTRVTGLSPMIDAPVARRFDGMTMCLCVKGTVRMLFNLDEVTARPNSLLFVPPDTVFKPISWEGEELEAYLLFLSNRFIHDINIDLNAINTSLFARVNLVLELDPERVKLLLHYFQLLHLNAVHDNNYSRYIARALTSAASYQIMAYGEEAAEQSAGGKAHTRKLTYAQTFLRLVREYHKAERAISFYAEKMFISPKYLSLIIKESTGKSAGEWIDQYVIQEAKNMLRYSGKNVQQISYELNFPNQSSFGKYFKNLTGMSPTAFQNTL